MENINFESSGVYRYFSEIEAEEVRSIPSYLFSVSKLFIKGVAISMLDLTAKVATLIFVLFKTLEYFVYGTLEIIEGLAGRKFDVIKMGLVHYLGASCFFFDDIPKAISMLFCDIVKLPLVCIINPLLGPFS